MPREKVALGWFAAPDAPNAASACSQFRSSTRNGSATECANWNSLTPNALHTCGSVHARQWHASPAIFPVILEREFLPPTNPRLPVSTISQTMSPARLLFPQQGAVTSTLPAQ
jgi:transposase